MIFVHCTSLITHRIEARRQPSFKSRYLCPQISWLYSHCACRSRRGPHTSCLSEIWAGASSRPRHPRSDCLRCLPPNLQKKLQVGQWEEFSSRNDVANFPLLCLFHLFFPKDGDTCNFNTLHIYWSMLISCHSSTNTKCIESKTKLHPCLLHGPHWWTPSSRLRLPTWPMRSGSAPWGTTRTQSCLECEGTCQARGGFHLKFSSSVALTFSLLEFSLWLIVTNSPFQVSRQLWVRFGIFLFPVAVTESGVQELGKILGRRREQHHSHPLHVLHRDVRTLHWNVFGWLLRMV